MVNQIFVPKENVPMDRFFIAPPEIYRETEARVAEKFGKESRAYKTIMNGIDVEKGIGSQFFFNNAMNLFLPKNQSVITLEDLDRIYGSELFDGTVNTDLRDLILRTKTLSFKKNKQILENLVKQIKAEGFDFNYENPLRILGLELIKDENPKNKYGLLLKIGKDTVIKNDERFAYEANELLLCGINVIYAPLYVKEIILNKISASLFTEKHDLSRVFLDWNSSLFSNNPQLDAFCFTTKVILKDTSYI